MRLKSFYAKTMTEAMQMVRDTLGEDAIIVATREERGGKGVRVTAAIEPGFHSDERSTPAFEVNNGSAGESENSRNDWLQYDDEDEEAAVTEDITDAMLRHCVPEDVLDQIISCSTVIGFEDPGIALIAAIEHIFHFEPLSKEPNDKAIMLMGTPGAGKTLAAAKIATRGVFNGLKMGVITADTVRAGGAEQLSAFTNLLQLDLHRVDDPAELGDTVRKLQKTCDQVVIDMPGLNPFSKDDIKQAARMIGSAPIHPILVLPAGLDAEECGEISRAFASVGAQSILSTRIDMSRRIGGLLAGAHRGGLSFTDASNTAKVADGLMEISPKSLSSLLMPHAYHANGSDTHSARGRDGAPTPSRQQTRKRLKT